MNLPTRIILVLLALPWAVQAQTTAPTTAPIVINVTPAIPIAAAWNQAQPGNVIQLASGTYPGQVIQDRPADAAWTQNVTIEPAPGATVNIAGTLDIRAQHLTLSGVETDGPVLLRWSATGSDVQDLTVTAGVVLYGNNQLVLGCTFNCYDADGVDVCSGVAGQQSSGCVIQGNVVNFCLYKNLTRTQIHLDAFQMWDTRNVTVSGNTVHRTMNADVIISPSRGGVIDVDRVLINDNHFEQVPQPGNLALWNIDARYGTNVVVTNNVLAGGVTWVAANPGNVMTGNVISYLEKPGEPENHNYVCGWNKGLKFSPDVTDVVGTAPLMAGSN